MWWGTRSPDVWSCMPSVELEEGVIIVEHVAASAVVMGPVVASAVPSKLDITKMPSINTAKKLPSAGRWVPMTVMTLYVDSGVVIVEPVAASFVAVTAVTAPSRSMRMAMALT